MSCAQERNGITPLRFMAPSDGGLFYYEAVDCVQRSHACLCVSRGDTAEERYCKFHRCEIRQFGDWRLGTEYVSMIGSNVENR
jgi:hypothetical protein